jgi:hypothetical protein
MEVNKNPQDQQARDPNVLGGFRVHTDSNDHVLYSERQERERERARFARSGLIVGVERRESQVGEKREKQLISPAEGETLL